MERILSRILCVGEVYLGSNFNFNEFLSEINDKACLGELLVSFESLFRDDIGRMPSILLISLSAPKEMRRGEDSSSEGKSFTDLTWFREPSLTPDYFSN